MKDFYSAGGSRIQTTAIEGGLNPIFEYFPFHGSPAEEDGMEDPKNLR